MTPLLEITEQSDRYTVPVVEICDPIICDHCQIDLVPALEEAERDEILDAQIGETIFFEGGDYLCKRHSAEGDVYDEGDY